MSGLVASTPAMGDDAASVTVLVLLKGLGLGGAERLVVEQVTGSSSRWRYEVARVRSDKDHYASTLAGAGVEVHDLGAGRRPWPLSLAHLLWRRRPQIVHAHSPLPAAVARLLVRAGCAGRGAKVVYTEHNRWSAYRWPTRILNAATMWLDHIGFAVSEEARTSIRPRLLRRRVETLHHGIDLDAVRAAAAAGTDGVVPDRRPGTFVALHVANGRPEKAHEVLIEAFDRAAEADPDVELWLVGQHLDRPWIRDAIAGCRHRNRLHVLGYRADVPALLDLADALVLSSDHEGLPVVVMEALALARPVIATAVGGLPEAITDGRDGILVPARDVGALSAAILRLAGEPSLVRRLGRAAADTASAYAGERARDAIEERYRDLVPDRAGHAPGEGAEHR